MDLRSQLKEKGFIDLRHTSQSRGVFVFLRRGGFFLLYLMCVGLLLWLAWIIPHSERWRSTVAPFLQANPFLVGILIVSLVLPLFWLLLWKLPQWQVIRVGSTKDRIDLEAKSRQTIAQIVGGAALLIGFYFTAQTIRITQEGQITDRFTKAIDQLGKDTLAVRLGGIYALERIARDSEVDHWTVMEVLIAFVREHPQERPQTLWGWITTPVDKAPQPTKEGSFEMCLSRLRSFEACQKEQDRLKPPPDIQAVLTVIGRRTKTWQQGEMQRINLFRAQLQGADLRGAQLQGADLSRTQLQGANLGGARLEGAFLTDAHLEGARLIGAHLEGATFGYAQLQGANFTSAHLEGTHLGNSDLEDAFLGGARLEGADLFPAKGLTQRQIDRACLDDNTRLPAGFTRPPPCP